MKETILRTEESYAPFIIRTLTGLVLLAHGAQKLLGWFGGYGFTPTMDFFTKSVHLPWIIGFLVIMIEFFGAIALVIGLGTRLISIAITILIIGIVFTSHFQEFFFMNWFGNHDKEGSEYFILMIAGSISLIISGGGKWSADAWFGGRPN